MERKVTGCYGDPLPVQPTCITVRVGPLVKKPVNNFSEDELYPPKPSPVHNPPFPHHTATSPLAHTSTVTTSPASPDIRLTSSLPAHLTGMASTSDNRQNGDLPDNQVTGTRHEPESHSESNDTHNGSLPQSLPPITDVEALANSNYTPEMTHHRNNSDFFVTPSSSPPASPLLAARVGHRAPSRTLRASERLLESFFSKAPKKFEDILLVENDQIPTVDFLECCRAVVPFFGEFGLCGTVDCSSLELHLV